jgi:hypothetical protein
LYLWFDLAALNCNDGRDGVIPDLECDEITVDISEVL